MGNYLVIAGLAVLMALTAAALIVTLFRRPHRHVPGEGPLA